MNRRLIAAGICVAAMAGVVAAQPDASQPSRVCGGPDGVSAELQNAE
jgi:hypothetical protein